MNSIIVGCYLLLCDLIGKYDARRTATRDEMLDSHILKPVCLKDIFDYTPITFHKMLYPCQLFYLINMYIEDSLASYLLVLPFSLIP